MNKVIITGHVTRDIEYKATSTTSIANFAINDSRKAKTEKGAKAEYKNMYLDCTAFGKAADFLSQHFRKGSAVMLHGTLDQDTWEDKQTGQKRSKHVLIVATVDFPPRDFEDKDGGQRSVMDGVPVKRSAKSADHDPFADDADGF